MCILLIMLSACTNQTAKEEVQQPAYCDEDENTTCSLGKNADMSGYEGLDAKNTQFEESDMDTVLKTFDEKKDGIFYFGYPGCPWCVEAVPVLNEQAKEAGVKIQYIQTRDAEKKLMYTEQQKAKLVPLVEQYLNKDDDGNYQIYVPFVLIVKNGVAKSGHIGTVDGHDAHERVMTDDEKTQLIAIYQEMLK